MKSPSGATEEMGILFSEDSSDHLVLDSRNNADTAVADTVHQIEKLGLNLYKTYGKERLFSQTIPIVDPVKRKTSISSAGLQSERSQANSYSCHP